MPNSVHFDICADFNEISNKSIFIKNKLDLFNNLSEFFKEIGIEIENNNKSDSNLQIVIFKDFISRNQKLIPITKDECKKSGDTNKYRYIENVINNFRFYGCTDCDKDLAININKSVVNRAAINDDLKLALYIIKHQLNKKYFESSLMDEYFNTLVLCNKQLETTH